MSGSGISAATLATVTNGTGGQISGVTSGITGGSVSVTNSGNISATIGGGVVTGGTLQVTYTMKNIGDQAAGESQTRVQIYTPLNTQYTDMNFHVGALAALELRRCRLVQDDRRIAITD